MPKVEVIKASDAPDAPKKMSKVTAEILGAIQGLNKDQVVKLEPDPGKTIRGLKTSVGRIASNNNLKVESWTDQEETALYVKKV